MYYVCVTIYCTVQVLPRGKSTVYLVKETLCKNQVENCFVASTRA